jgi:hypothetical protein
VCFTSPEGGSEEVSSEDSVSGREEGSPEVVPGVLSQAAMRSMLAKSNNASHLFIGGVLSYVHFFIF